MCAFFSNSFSLLFAPSRSLRVSFSEHLCHKSCITCSISVNFNCVLCFGLCVFVCVRVFVLVHVCVRRQTRHQWFGIIITSSTNTHVRNAVDSATISLSLSHSSFAAVHIISWHGSQSSIQNCLFTE